MPRLAHSLLPSRTFFSGTRDTMVSVARANTLAKLTRVTATETAALDTELATMATDPWAVEARGTIEALFSAMEAAEDVLHRMVMNFQDTLELAQAPPPRRVARPASGSAAASSGTQQPGTGVCGSGALSRSPSLSRILAEQQSLPRTSMASPRAPVAVHDLPADAGVAQTARVPALQELPPVPAPSRPVPLPQPAAALGGARFTPVTLLVKAPPPLAGMRVSSVGAQPKPPPPVLGQTTAVVTPLTRAPAARTTFLMPGVEIRYGKAAAATPTQGARRQSQPWGTTSATALARDGPPFFFEDGFPAGWKMVMGDLPADTDANEARRM